MHGDALRWGQVPVTPRPVFRLALDALAIGKVLTGTTRPEQPRRGEVEPKLLGAHPGLVHDLKRQRVPCMPPGVRHTRPRGSRKGWPDSAGP